MVFFSICATIILFLEVYARVTSPKISKFDDHLGWKLKSNLNRTINQENFSGDTYKVVFSTDVMGLRSDIKNSSEFTILVLGDSFTSGYSASNNKMWYSIFTKLLGDKLNKEISLIAGGGGGWGTYQNLLLLQQIKEHLNYDIFIFQFCSNDFENNLYEWDSHVGAINQYLNRPYARVENDKIVTYRANSLSAILYRTLVNNSRVLAKLGYMLQRYQHKKLSEKILRIPRETIKEYTKKSITITGLLMKEISNAVGKKPKFVVNCSESSDPELKGKWKKLAIDAGFVVMEQPSIFVEKLQKKDDNDMFEYLNYDGGHLSDAGNVLFGEILFKEFEEKDYVKYLRVK